MMRLGLLCGGVACELLAACGASGNYVEGTVESVQRACAYTETMTTTSSSGSKSRSTTQRKLDCSDDPEFVRIKRGDSSKRLKGEATAIVRYTSAVDHKDHQAWVKVSASSRDFYELEKGQKVRVRIDPEDDSVGYL